ncbi:MAG: acylphosphatase [Burkholderiaceae bacterium]
MAARRFVIRGVVQGVGFRHATRREARRLGLIGWVRNRADGSVEAVAVGDERQLDGLQRWVHRGPTAAIVDTVEITPLSDDSLAGLQPIVDGAFRQVDTAWE